MDDLAFSQNISSSGTLLQLKKGIIAESDQGISCIDNINKVEKYEQILMEAMDSKSIIVQTNSLLLKVRTETSIIASAEPKRDKIR